MSKYTANQLTPSTLVCLFSKKEKIDDYISKDMDSENFLDYINTISGISVEIVRRLGEYTVYGDNVFSFNNNEFEDATSSLSFTKDGNILEAGITIITNKYREIFMETTPENMLGFVSMIGAQVESAVNFQIRAA